MKSRPPLLFESGPGFVGATPEIDAFENFDQVKNPHNEAGFLLQLAFSALHKRFAEFQGAAWNGPLSQERFAAPADQQSAPFFNHHAAHAHNRFFRIFPPGTHAAPLSTGFSPVIFGAAMRTKQLISRAAVYNTTVGGGRDSPWARPAN